MNEELQKRVDRWREDFERVTGNRFEHFYCPILRIDEPAPLCKGHIVADGLKTSSAWVPQREDVDHFFGHVAEADFISIIRDRDKDPINVWLDPSLRKTHRPRLEYNGEVLEHYFHPPQTLMEGHTVLAVVGPEGRNAFNFVVKKSKDELMELDGKEIQVVVDRDCIPAIVASVLKSAHLSLFNLLGYEYVLSPSGIYVAEALAGFFRKHGTKRQRELAEPLEWVFRPLTKMISPIKVTSPDYLRGTVIDRKVVACVGQSGKFFAIGVIVPAQQDLFCVFIPMDDTESINTYTGFLNEPPPSICSRIMHFVPAGEQEESHWITEDREPIRIPLAHAI
jgi:hypothetical protein